MKPKTEYINAPDVMGGSSLPDSQIHMLKVQTVEPTLRSVGGWTEHSSVPVTTFTQSSPVNREITVKT